MIGLLREFARQHELVRAAYLNGSRTNPHVKKDPYQDYDIVYLVSDLKPFLADKSWLNYFGEVAIKQEPAALDALISKTEPSTIAAGFYMFLVLYTDGNRLDITIVQKAVCQSHLAEDRLLIPLLDKEELLIEVPLESSDETHWIAKPTAEQYFASCNEFWWCMQNVAKGIVREEVTYAQAMLENVVRPAFNQIIFWRIASAYEFKISLGKEGKFLPRYLSESNWQAYLKTYSNGETIEMRRSMWLMMDIFSEESQNLAHILNFEYNGRDEKAIRNYIRQIEKIEYDSNNNIM